LCRAYALRNDIWRHSLTTSNLVLKFRAPDKPGIMAATTTALAMQGCDIREAEVHGDDDTGHFFLRMALTSPLDRDTLAKVVEPVAAQLDLDWDLHDLGRPLPVLLA